MVNGLTRPFSPVERGVPAQRTHDSSSSSVLAFPSPTEFSVVPGPVTVGELARSSRTKTHEEVVREGKYRPRRGPAPGRRQGPRCREEAKEQGKKSGGLA